MVAQDVLVDRVINVTQNYLGPAGARFIKRQIIFHLKIKPQDLRREDLPKLVEWVKVSLALLTEDSQMVDRCERDILALGAN
jgi:hypothetical protein